MTVIAYRDGIMAADTATFLYGTTRSPGAVKKILRLRDGSLFSGAGKRAERRALANWIENGMEGERPSTPDTTCILVRPDRTVAVFDGDDDVEFGSVEFYAIGSGGTAALGAMYAGATAERAAKIATLIDPFCGGDIQVEHVGST